MIKLRKKRFLKQRTILIIIIIRIYKFGRLYFILQPYIIFQEFIRDNGTNIVYLWIKRFILYQGVNIIVNDHLTSIQLISIYLYLPITYFFPKYFFSSTSLFIYSCIDNCTLSTLFYKTTLNFGTHPYFKVRFSFSSKLY